MIGIGTNCATDASSGGALDGWKPSALSVIETDCAPTTVLAGTAGTPVDGPLGAGELATAVVGAGAGVAALADEEDDVSGDEESGDDFFDPVSTVDTSSGGGAAPGGAAAVSEPARNASAL